VTSETVFLVHLLTAFACAVVNMIFLPLTVLEEQSRRMESMSLVSEFSFYGSHVSKRKEGDKEGASAPPFLQSPE
jgi:hypothetical protein